MTDTSTINSLGGYPLGAANDSRAPYNEKPKKIVSVNVTISVTYSKTLDIAAPEGYTDADLREIVEEMGILPNDILRDKHTELRNYIKSNENKLDDKYKAKLIKKRDNCKPWHEDELEVISNGTEAHLLF
jgi:hypothetical protein